MNKALVVGSPHSASTRDVWIGWMKGLALNGVNVQSFDLFPLTEFFSAMIEYAKEKNWRPSQLRQIPSPTTISYAQTFMAAHKYECDTVVFVSPQYLTMEIPELLRKDGFKVYAVMTECPYEDSIDAAQKAPYFDGILLNDRNSEHTWRSYNPNSHYIPHSYDPDKHFPSWDRPKHRRFYGWQPPENGHDHVVYVGSGFGRRQKYLEQVDWSGIDLKVYGHWPNVYPQEPDSDAWMGDARSDKESPILPYVIPKMVENTFTARLYRGAAIGINLHREERFGNSSQRIIDEGEAYSMGPRGVELAACGLFQTSDPRQEIIDVFGDSVPIHSSPDELGAIVRTYLADPVRRQELAVQQREAIKDRTFANNVRRALEQIAA